MSVSGQGPLSFDAIINDSNFQSRLDAMERRMLGFTSTTIRETAKMDQQFARLGQLALGAFSFGKLVELPAQIFKVRSEVEGLEIAFGTMLKSKAKADALLGDLRTFEANTPFGSQEVATGAKQLLAYGFAAKDIIPTLSTLGNVSAGLGLPLERLTYLFGTTKTQGRLFAQDLNQFVGSGIPLISQLAIQFGVSEEKVRGLVEAGKVGFSEVKKALESLTTGGGIFAGTLDAQSKSLNGLAERLGSAYRNMLNDIGKQNEGVAFELINTATVAVEHYQEFVDVLSIIASAYGTYRAALIVTNVVQKLASLEQIRNTAITEAQAIAQAQAASASSALSLSQIRLATASAAASQAQAAGATVAARAQLLLNNAISANPYVLAATAIAGLVAAYFVFRDEVIAVKSAQELLAETSKDVNSKFNSQQTEVKSLVSTIGNQNVAESERLKAYEKLNSIAPEILSNLSFQKAKTQDLTKATNDYLTSLKKRIQLEAGESAVKKAYDQDSEAAERFTKAQDDLIKKTNAAKKTPKLQTGPDARGGGVGASLDLAAAQKEFDEARAFKKKTEQAIKDADANVTQIITGVAGKQALQANIRRQEQLMAAIPNKLGSEYKEAEDQLVKYREELQKVTTAEQAGQTVKAKTIDQLNAEIKTLKESQDQQSSKSGFVEIQKQIDALENQKRRITGELTKEQKKAEKDADKVGPLGSVTYYENISKKAQEILDKTPTSNKGVIARQLAIKLDADRHAEEARKAITTRSFDEEIEYKRDQYELYQKWVDAYGKASADTQFEELIKSGQGYLDYLNTQIAALEAKKNNGKLSTTDTSNLSGLLDQRNEITAKKSGINLFQEGLEKARVQSANLADYLAVLKKKQEELDTKPDTAEWFKLRQQVAEQIIGTQQDLRGQLTQYVQDITGSEEQRLAVTKKYADLRAGLEEQYRGRAKGSTQYNALKAKIDKGEADEVKAINERAVEASEAFKKLDEVILLSGRKAMKERLEGLNKALEEQKALADTQAYQQKLKERNDLEVAIKDDDLTRINEFGQLVGQLGEAYMELGGAVGDAGTFIAGFTSKLSLVTSAFKDNMSAAEGAQLILSATVDIISSITSAAAQRKQAEEAYYASVIAQQTEYNQLLNQQIGLQSEQDENVFTKDYEGRLKDRYAQLAGAQKGYAESLKKLNEGMAKTGQRDKVDWGAVGKNAASGAAIGAVAGPIGIAVGAVVGSLVGLFAAKKKADEFGSLLATYPELVTKTKDGQTEFNKELAQTLINQGLVDDKTKALLQDTLDWTKQMEEAQAAVKAIVADLVGGLGDKLRDNLVNAFKDGTDSAIAFGDAVSDILENLVTKMLFSKAFNEVLTDLQDDMSKSLDTQNGGDGAVIDDFQRFTENSKASLAQYNEWLKQFQDAAAASGISVLKPTSTDAKANPNSMSGAIKGVTEETAGVLAGQISAIRITQADTNGLIRQQLLHLSNISANSNYLSNLNYLKSMDERLGRIESNGKSDPLRAKGI